MRQVQQKQETIGAILRFAANPDGNVKATREALTRYAQAKGKSQFGESEVSHKLKDGSTIKVKSGSGASEIEVYLPSDGDPAALSSSPSYLAQFIVSWGTQTPDGDFKGINAGLAVCHFARFLDPNIENKAAFASIQKLLKSDQKALSGEIKSAEARLQKLKSAVSEIDQFL